MQYQSTRIHTMDSAETLCLLATHHLSLSQLQKALEIFVRRGNGPVVLALGMSSHGFHFTMDPEWTPELGVDCSCITVPWLQLFECLGMAPKGIMEEFLNSGARFH